MHPTNPVATTRAVPDLHRVALISQDGRVIAVVRASSAAGALALAIRASDPFQDK